MHSSVRRGWFRSLSVWLKCNLWSSTKGVEWVKQGPTQEGSRQLKSCTERNFLVRKKKSFRVRAKLVNNQWSVSCAAQWTVNGRRGLFAALPRAHTHTHTLKQRYHTEIPNLQPNSLQTESLRDKYFNLRMCVCCEKPVSMNEMCNGWQVCVCGGHFQKFWNTM